ncbi:hypothetical protein [Bartonella sp. DGB1]|uniref:hypothetical protein n=1 Tax=Bartonella sp. DGB1 TaxID=3239807 RepID=UPI00352441B9
MYITCKYIISLLAILLSLTNVFITPIAKEKNQVKIIVNGMPVTSYDIKNRMSLIKLQGYQGPDLEATAKRSLIDQIIKQTETLKANIETPNELLSEAVTNLAKQNNMTIGQFKQLIETNNVSFQHFIDSISVQIAWERFIGNKLREKVFLESEKSAKNLKKDIKDIPSVKAYVLKSVTFFVPQDSSDEFINKRYKEIKKLQTEVKHCNQLKEKSSKYNNVIYNHLGLKSLDEFPEPYQKLILDTKISTLSEPIRTNEGLSSIMVCSIENIKNDAVVRHVISNKKFQSLTQQEFMEEEKKLFNELKSKAIIINAT